MSTYMIKNSGFSIVEVVHNWPAETFIQRHVKALHDVDFPVHVIARHGFDSTRTSASLEFEGDSVTDATVMPNFNHLNWMGKIINIRHITANSLLSRFANAISEKTLLGYFERLRPDLIHFHDTSLAASMSWIPFALDLPYTLSLRGSDIQVFPLQSPNRKEEIASAIIMAAGVHAVCLDLVRQASKLAMREIDHSTIYTTVPIPDNLPAWNAPADGEEVRFISSGRLVWHKGFDNLLIALKQVRDMGVNARLTLIGVGPDLNHLLYLRNTLGLNEYVEFPGKLGYEQMRKIFMNSHAYIQSSVAEGLSNSLAEAMANGLPVFATDVGGTREVIEDGVTGFLLPPFEQQEWAKKTLLIQDTSLISRARTLAYEKARTLFAAGSHAQAFIDFYVKAMKRESRHDK